MALQNRYGDYSNFDPDKMVTGEIAVVVSGDPNSENGRSVYVCFAPGIVKRFTTYSDFESEIQNATEDVQNQFTEEIRLTIESAVEETARATNAAEAAQTAAENAIEAAAAANAAAGGDISNKTVTFSTSSNRELLTSGENTSGLFGKIAKWFSDLKNAAFCDVANNLVTTEEGYLLDARQGKILDDKISEQNTNMEWKKAGSSYNTNSISVPSTAKEVKVMVIVKLTDTTVPLVFDFSYINEFPLNSQQFRTVGYYYGSNDWASIGIGTSVNGVLLQSSWTKLKYSGTEYTLSSVASYSIHVYYR